MILIWNNSNKSSITITLGTFFLWVWPYPHPPDSAAVVVAHIFTYQNATPFATHGKLKSAYRKRLNSYRNFYSSGFLIRCKLKQRISSWRAKRIKISHCGDSNSGEGPTAPSHFPHPLSGAYPPPHPRGDSLRHSATTVQHSCHPRRRVINCNLNGFN